VRSCAFSVVGQCLFYFHARPIVTRLQPSQKFEPQDVEALARHVTGFSLGAIRAMSGGAATKGGVR
jgi:hypothetical protein